MPISFRVRASLVEAPFLSASTNDRCGFRVDRLRPAIPFRFFHDTSTPLRLPLRASATPSLCYGSWRYIASSVTNYLHTSIPTFPRHLRLRLRCRVRSHFSVPRNLRLLFRPVRTGIFTPSSNRRTAAIRHHPPTHKRTDERTEISPWHSLIYRPFGQYGFAAEGRM